MVVPWGKQSSSEKEKKRVVHQLSVLNAELLSGLPPADSIGKMTQVVQSTGGSVHWAGNMKNIGK